MQAMLQHIILTYAKRQEIQLHAFASQVGWSHVLGLMALIGLSISVQDVYGRGFNINDMMLLYAEVKVGLHIC